MVRACGNNAKRKNCEESVLRMPRRIKVRCKATKEMVGRC